MADAELEEMRKKRLTQLQSAYKEDASEQNSQNVEKDRDKSQEAKNSILSQILDQSARARLNTLMLGKPEKGKAVENMLLHMVYTGQLCTKIGEQELIRVLENIDNQTQSKPSVKFDRRRAALDNDDF